MDNQQGPPQQNMNHAPRNAQPPPPQPNPPPQQHVADSPVTAMVGNFSASSIIDSIKQRIGEGIDKVESIINNGSNNGMDLSSTFNDTNMILNLPSSLVEKPERMALFLLLPDILIARYHPTSTSFLSSGKGTLFGRILVIANAIHHISWAKNGLSDPIGTWARSGLKLSAKTPSDQSIAWLSFLGFTITGYAAVVAGILSPNNHVLSVFALALQKIGIVVACLNQARHEPEMQQNEDVLSLTKYNIRTGFLLLIYGFLLIWRNRLVANIKPATPAYIDAMEKRLNVKIDALMSQLKSHNNQNDKSKGATSTSPTSSSTTTPTKIEAGGSQKPR